MKKKLTIIFLSVAMIFCFCACGLNNKELLKQSKTEFGIFDFYYAEYVNSFYQNYYDCIADLETNLAEDATNVKNLFDFEFCIMSNELCTLALIDYYEKAGNNKTPDPIGIYEFELNNGEKTLLYSIEVSLSGQMSGTNPATVDMFVQDKKNTEAVFSAKINVTSHYYYSFSRNLQSDKSVKYTIKESNPITDLGDTEYTFTFDKEKSVLIISEKNAFAKINNSQNTSMFLQNMLNYSNGRTIRLFENQAKYYNNNITLLNVIELSISSFNDNSFEIKYDVAKTKKEYLYAVEGYEQNLNGKIKFSSNSSFASEKNFNSITKDELVLPQENENCSLILTKDAITESANQLWKKKGESSAWKKIG